MSSPYISAKEIQVATAKHGAAVQSKLPAVMVNATSGRVCRPLQFAEV
jgi:hypothetical protein